MKTLIANTPIYDISLVDIEDRKTTLAEYAGRGLPVVNLTSRCVFAPQHGCWENLLRKHGYEGFTVCGFPSNDFLFQEPECYREIHDFFDTQIHCVILNV